MGRLPCCAGLAPTRPSTEIADAFCRAELTNAQRAKHIKRRAQIWEASHPVQKVQRSGDFLPKKEDEIQVGQLVPPEFQTGYKCPPPQTKGFAASTAKATGKAICDQISQLTRPATTVNAVRMISMKPAPKGTKEGKPA